MAEPQIDYAALAAKHGGSAREEPPPPAGTWEDRGVAGRVWHPAVPPAGERADSDVVGGIPLFGGISPEAVVAGGVGVGRALAAPAAHIIDRALAGAKALGDQVSPQIKYEVAKTSLQAVGVPAPAAMAMALVISGLKRGAKETPTTEAPSGPHLDRSAPMRPGEMTQQQIGERLRFGTGTPPAKAAPKPMIGVTAQPPAVPVEPVASGLVAPAPQAAAPVVPTASAPQPSAPLPPSAPVPSPGAPVPADPSAAAMRMGPDGLLVGRPGGNPAMPDQRTLNDAALAIRRQAAQSRLAAGSAPPASSAVPETAAYVKPAPLTKAETVAFWDYIKRGMSGADAMKTIESQRALLQSGMVSDAERIAAQDARYTRGEVKTPSAETARARKGSGAPKP